MVPAIRLEPGAEPIPVEGREDAHLRVAGLPHTNIAYDIAVTNNRPDAALMAEMKMPSPRAHVRLADLSANWVQISGPGQHGHGRLRQHRSRRSH